MPYIKKADREAAEMMKLAGQPQDAGGTPIPEKGDEAAELRGMVATMQKQINQLLDAKKQTGSVRRDRTREHFALLREWEGGIAVRVSDVRETKDPREHKRLIGLCNIEIVDPKTGATKNVQEADYLQFLNDSPKVKAKIVKWEKKERYESGGRGPLKRIIGENEVVTDPDHEFEVVFTDQTFELEILEGSFAGLTMTVGESALNI